MSKFILLCYLLTRCYCKSLFDQSQTGDLNVQVDLKDLQIIALLKGDREEYYEDIDYVYDYSEMTIKPQSGTSQKPLNVTSTTDNTSNNATIATTIYIEQTTVPTKNSSWENSENLEVTPQPITNYSTTTKNNIEVTTDSPELSLTTIAQIKNTNDYSETLKSQSEVATVTANSSEIDTAMNQQQATTTTNDLDTTERNQSEIKPPVLESNITQTLAPNITSNCRKGFVSNKKGGCDLRLQSMSNALLKIVKLSQKLKSRRHNRGSDHDIV